MSRFFRTPVMGLDILIKFLTKIHVNYGHTFAFMSQVLVYSCNRSIDLNISLINLYISLIYLDILLIYLDISLIFMQKISNFPYHASMN